MYRVAIVDEVPFDIQRFQRYVHRNDTEKKFTVVPFEPKPKLDELLADMFNANLDAVVSDYRLNEFNASITYDGVDLVNAVLKRRNEFPCFVLTSFDDDAVKDSDDVNIVYFKGILTSATGAKFSFLQRIEKQVQKYKAKIKSLEEELVGLEEVRKDRLLDPVEEDRYVELNHLLDKSIIGENSIPRAFYSTDTNKKLDSLLERTTELLQRINKTESSKRNTDQANEFTL